MDLIIEETTTNPVTEATNSISRTKLENLASEVMESVGETAVIAVTVSLLCVLALAVMYTTHYFLKRKRQMVLPISSRGQIACDYFTRPRPPVLFLNECDTHPMNNTKPQGLIYWQRPLQPVTTDKDLYSVITRY